MRRKTFSSLVSLAFLFVVDAVGGDAVRPTSDTRAKSPPNEQYPEPNRADREFRAWSRDLWCRLLADREPIVRVSVSDLVEQLEDGPFPVRCGSPPLTPDVHAIRLAALKADGENPALVYKVYALECDVESPAPWCHNTNARELLVALDPDNAFPHLLYLRSSTPAAETAMPFNAAEIEHLLAAASAHTMNSYWGEGLPDVYIAIQRIIDELPPPEFSEESQSEWAESGLSPERPADIAIAYIFAAKHAVSSLSPFTRTHNGCKAAYGSGDDIVVTGCDRLAELLLEHSTTTLGESLGRALVEAKRIADGFEPTPDWRRHLLGVIDICRQPRSIVSSRSEIGPMPEGETLQFLDDLVRHGESAAFARKAAREYALHPEAFPVEPARCGEIMDLSEPQQRELVALWRDDAIAGPEAWDKVLTRAATMLDE